MHWGTAAAFRFYFIFFLSSFSPLFFLYVSAVAFCWKICELKIDFGCHASRKIRSEADESSACICAAFFGGRVRVRVRVCLGLGSWPFFRGCVRDTKL